MKVRESVLLELDEFLAVFVCGGILDSKWVARLCWNIGEIVGHFVSVLENNVDCDEFVFDEMKTRLTLNPSWEQMRGKVFKKKWFGSVCSKCGEFQTWCSPCFLNVHSTPTVDKTNFDMPLKDEINASATRSV